MTTSTPRHKVEKPRLTRIYEPIAAELARVEQILQGELRNPHPFVDELIRHSFRLGGKRLRPVLVLLTGRATGQLTDEHLTLAAVVEMIHTATLLHDDVLDEADTRRHLQTVNARWNNEASVLSGDYLFSHAFYLASTTGSTFACQVIGQSTNIVCEGELRQIHSRGNIELTEAEYLEIIEAKTAELCSCCCHLGAHFAGAPQNVIQAAGKFGRYLGIAFQIADDLLDLVGAEEEAGKSLGTDLQQQKMTLPLIRLLATASAADQPRIRELFASSSRPDQAELRQRVAQSDACDYARDRALQFVDLARHELSLLPDNEATGSLRAACEFVVSRRQ